MINIEDKLIKDVEIDVARKIKESFDKDDNVLKINQEVVAIYNQISKLVKGKITKSAKKDVETNLTKSILSLNENSRYVNSLKDSKELSGINNKFRLVFDHYNKKHELQKKIEDLDKKIDKLKEKEEKIIKSKSKSS